MLPSTCRLSIIRLLRQSVFTLLLVALLTSSLPWLPSPVLAASCTTTVPLSGAYSVTICFTEPVDGAVVRGNTAVTATVTVNGTAPRIQRVLFTLDGAYVLTDFFAPSTFILPSDQWADGQHELSARVLLSDGFLSDSTSLPLFFQNGVSSPPPLPNGFVIPTGSKPPVGQPFVVTAVGDGPDGGNTTAAATAQLIESVGSNLFLYLGDVYEKGSYTEFLNYYGSDGQLFDAFRSITLPVIGNHEYESSEAPGYFRHWQNPPCYYSTYAGGWHFIALNLTRQFNQLVPGTPQFNWLLRELQANRDACTIALFHYPRFSIGPQGDTPALQEIWKLLYGFGVEVVLTGHDHNYQRWVPLDDTGNPTETGIVQFIVGTGGHGIRGFTRTDDRVAFGLDRAPDAYGVVKAALSPSGAIFSFIDVQGQTRDTTTIPCHGPNDSLLPTTPTGLVAIPNSSGGIDLRWHASEDNILVDKYEILRDGQVLTTVPATLLSYQDTTVKPNQTYTYQVIAIDALGNRSQPSSPSATTSSALFADGFESGTLDQWSTVVGMTVTTDQPHTGTYAAEAISSGGSSSYAVGSLVSPASDLEIELWFQIVSKGGNAVTITRWRTSTGRGIGNIYVATNNRLTFRNEVTATTLTTPITVSLNSWHKLSMRVTTGASGFFTLLYDDEVIIQEPQNFGSSPIASLQIGEHRTTRQFHLRFDDVRVSLPFSPPTDTSPPETILVDTPPSSTTSTSASFTFTASEPATFSCSLDGSPFEPCSSPLDLNDLTIGIHTFVVQATDLAGNPDPTPASYSWEITASSAPDTILISTPPSLTNQTEATFIFTASDPAASFECQLDDTPVILCSSPWTITNLSEGEHTVAIRAVDGEGNTDPTPATWTWSIDLTPPSAPTITDITAESGTRVTMSWSEVSDPSGINGYDVLRDGNLIAQLGPVTRFTDSTVQPNTVYTYAVVARDHAGNASVASSPATITTPSLRLFEDDFESGHLLRWSQVNGLAITTEFPANGSYAAQALSTGGTPAYALGTPSQPTGELFLRVRFNLVSQDSHAVYLVKWRRGTSSSVGEVYISSTGKLGIRNDIAGQSSSTNLTTTPNTWHTIVVHIRVGSSGIVELWYDGSRIHQSFENFGSDPLTHIQLGENSPNWIFDVRFDDITGDTAAIEAPADTIPPETSLTMTPPDWTTDTSVTFAFTASELATFLCRLDGAPAQPCTSPVTYSDLSVGPHTFEVQAVDLSGNLDPNPAFYSWSISSGKTASDTILLSHPPALTNLAEATFTCTSDDPATTFACQLDTAPSAPCSSPWVLESLTEGEQRAVIAAINSADQPDPTLAVWTWVVDLTPPSSPTELTAIAQNGPVTLNWQPSSDLNGITGYQVLRDGSVLTT